MIAEKSRLFFRRGGLQAGKPQAPKLRLRARRNPVVQREPAIDDDRSAGDVTRKAIAQQSDRHIRDIGDLNGLRIGIESGTLADAILMNFHGGQLIDQITHVVPGRQDLLGALERDEFDATLLDLRRFDAYRAAHPDTRLAASGYYYPIGANRGYVALASDAALLAAVNKALLDLQAKGTIAELADLLREHFSTPVSRYYSGPATEPPNRMVYLLDHEYTPRGRLISGAPRHFSSRFHALNRIACSSGRICDSVGFVPLGTYFCTPHSHDKDCHPEHGRSPQDADGDRPPVGVGEQPVLDLHLAALAVAGVAVGG